VKVLVTGGCGYLGAPTVSALLEAGHDVRVFDALMYDDIYLRDVDFACGNVLDWARLVPHLNWADAVVWLAALVGDAVCEVQQEVARLTNADAVHFARKAFGGRIVFPSTCSVYGRRDELLSEESDVAPLSVYGKTKAEAETRLRDSDAVVFRLGTLFGLPGEHGRFRLDLVINAMSVSAVRNRSIEVFGGKQWRPFLHVKDAAAAMVLGLAGPSGIYNLVGANLTIGQLAQTVAAEAPSLKVHWREDPGADARDYRVLGEKARDVLGFAPATTVRQGVREVIDLYTSGRLANPDAQRFHNREHQRARWGV